MRRVRTFLAFSVLAPTMALTLVITGGGQPAYAFKPPVDLGKVAKEGIQIGQKIAGSELGGTAIKGASLYGRFSNPVGWAITAGGAAWWGYENRDSIMNFLHGDSTPKTVQEWETSLGAKWDYGEKWSAAGKDGLIGVEIKSVTGRTVTYNIYCNNAVSKWNNDPPYYMCVNTDGKYWGLGNPGSAYQAGQTYADSSHGPARARCVNSAGVAREVWFDLLVGIPGSTGSASDFNRTRTLDLCSSGESVVGFYIPPADKKPGRYNGDWYHQFGIKWGFINLPGTAPLGGNVKPEDTLVFQEADVTARCKNALTGDTTTIKATSDLGSSGNVVVPSCKEHLGEDWYGTGFTIAPTKPETETGEPLPDEWDVPDFPPVEWDELIPDKTDADWQPCLGTKDGCSLGVWIDDVPCAPGNASCNQWTRVLERTPDRVKCMYGSKPVEMKNCLPIGYPITPTQPGQVTNPDVNQQPGNGTQTNPNSGTKPGTSSPSVGQAVTAPPVPAQATDAGAQKQCFPKGWGMLNPFEWVYKPVTCAFEWAFKPRTELSVRIDRMRAKVANRAPFTWLASLTALPTSVGGGGCPTNWAVTIQGKQYSLICGTPVEGVVRAARPVFVVLVLGAAIAPLLRSLVYSSTPIVKPTPT